MTDGVWEFALQLVPYEYYLFGESVAHTFDFEPEVPPVVESKTGFTSEAASTMRTNVIMLSGCTTLLWMCFGQRRHGV